LNPIRYSLVELFNAERPFGQPVGQRLGQDSPPPTAGLDDLTPHELPDRRPDDPNIEPGEPGQDGQLCLFPLQGLAVEGEDQGKGLGRLEQSIFGLFAFVKQPLE